MACANTKCGHKFLCDVKSDESFDVQECENARIIAMWWRDMKNGRLDRKHMEIDEIPEIPFADEEGDFTPEDLEDG